MSGATRAAPLDPALVDRRRLTLIATIVGSSMTFIDGTVVNIALPTIGRDLHAALSAQQWIMLSYSLAVASLYIAAGALGDRFGRRPLFEIGVAGFAVASMLCGVAPNTSLLIAGRVLQGVFGALLATNSLALLRATFGADSGRAVGQWTAWTGISTLIGPPIGGLLVEYASWRWIFFINLPAAAATIVFAVRGRIDEQATESPRPINVPASALVTVMFASLTFALIEGPRTGWVAVAWAFGLSFVALVLFVVNERRSTKPLLPLALLHERAFVVANVCTFVVYATLGASMFYLALYLQSEAVGYTPVLASLVFIPVSVIMFFLAARFGRLADRDGPRIYLTLGPIVMAARHGAVLAHHVDDPHPDRSGRHRVRPRALDHRGADHERRPESGSGPVFGIGGRREHDGLSHGWADLHAAARCGHRGRLRVARRGNRWGSIRNDGSRPGGSSGRDLGLPRRHDRRGGHLRVRWPDRLVLPARPAHGVTNAVTDEPRLIFVRERSRLVRA